MVEIKPLTRRMLLRGTGGIAVAMPFLPSLAPRSQAGETLGAPKRFISLTTGHGGAWGQFQYPGDDTLTEQQSYTGHTIRRGDLVSTVGDGVRQICPILSGDANVLTDEMVGKISVLRGLDIPFYISHHFGGCMGNYDATTNEEVRVNLTARPTIDQLMAYSDSFYGGKVSVLERSLVINQSYSHGWSDPQAGTGEIQRLPATRSNLELFERVFVEQSPDEPPENPRPLVVDRLMEQYNSLRQGDRRLGAADRIRLDEHMSKLDELERRLTTIISCGDVEPPTQGTEQLTSAQDFITNTESQREYWGLLNDVIVTALLCDTCRVVSLGADGPFFAQGVTFADWHQEIAHQARNQTLTQEQLSAGVTTLPQHDLWPGYQAMFEFQFLDLMNKLNIADPYEGNLLDNSLMVWQQESGRFTHDSLSLPAVTAGGAGGAWRTGQYIDFRDRSQNVMEAWVTGQDPDHPPPEEMELYTGLFHAQFLGTVLDAMDMPRAEWEVETGGYGDSYKNPYGPDGFVHPAARDNARFEALPWALV